MCRGGGREADMRRAGQCMAWNLYCQHVKGNNGLGLYIPDDILANDMDVCWPSLDFAWVA